MRKRALITISVIGVTLLLLVLLGPFPQRLAATSSPARKYTVRISQRRTFPLFERYVYLFASRDGNSFINGKLLFTGDFMDEDFTQLYPNYSWLSESILTIGRRETPATDKLEIVNGPNHLKYLLVETHDDKFVLFDIEPGQAIKLDFHYFGQLSAQGEFAATGKRFGDAIELENETVPTATTFAIRIGPETVSIDAGQQFAKHTRCCAVDRPDFDHE